MRPRRFVIGTVVLLAMIGFWIAQPADAIIIVNSKGVDTGMLGLAASQTARIHVVNGSGFSADGPACVVEVRFLDSAGAVLNRDQMKLMPGQAAFTDYADPTLRSGDRRHVRAMVHQMLPGDFDQATAVCMVTAEVFDNRTGQAGIIIVNSHSVR